MRCHDCGADVGLGVAVRVEGGGEGYGGREGGGDRGGGSLGTGLRDEGTIGVVVVVLVVTAAVAVGADAAVEVCRGVRSVARCLGRRSGRVGTARRRMGVGVPGGRGRGMGMTT